MKTFLISLGCVGLLVLAIALPVLGDAMGLVTIPFLTFHSKVQLNRDVIATTYDSQYCIQNYEWFKQQEQDINGIDTQIANAQQQLDDFIKLYGSDTTKWSFTANQTYSEDSTTLTGLKNIKQQKVNDYNAKSNELNRVACKDLPLYINP